MNSTDEYKVAFGKVARTIAYEDAKEAIVFTFDIGTSEGQKYLILERPVATLREIDSIEDERLKGVERSRLDVAFERTRQFVLAHGHLVKIWPDEFRK